MTSSAWLDVSAGEISRLAAQGAEPPLHHVWEPAAVDAINAALAAGRALLVRGEPGTGKSQLARAAAHALNRPLVSMVVDARTEARDLLWTFDAVERLAEAQVLGAVGGVDRDQVRTALAERRFVRPGPLWWAFDWRWAAVMARAERACPIGWRRADGVVVLIDEIDKADSDVPNGLLEALGAGRFVARGFRRAVTLSRGAPPLVVITTNEERALPDAFLRRCLVLQLGLPAGEDKLVDFLVARGRAHFPDAAPELLSRAARLLVSHRERVRRRGLMPPGQAEYLDLLRAALQLEARDARDLLDVVAPYAFDKHPPEAAS
ncbi:MAG: MoxR family ATPase [Planctomycetota bacterium]